MPAALSVAAIIDMNLGHNQRAERRADQALQLFSAAGDARGVADILDGRAMATFPDGHITDAVTAFDRVAHDFESQGELLRVVTPRSTRGHGLLFMDQPDHALAEIDRALELARTLGHAEGITFTQWHRSEVLATLGRFDDGDDAATEALHIARHLGHRGWTATALLGLGTVQAAQEDITAAITTLRDALHTADGLPLFSAWAAARLGMLLLRGGHLDEAVDLSGRAFRVAPGLARYEADLLAVAIATAKGPARRSEAGPHSDGHLPRRRPPPGPTCHRSARGCHVTRPDPRSPGLTEHSHELRHVASDADTVRYLWSHPDSAPTGTPEEPGPDTAPVELSGALELVAETDPA